MKKITCTSFLFFCLPALLFAQTSITPTSAFRGQTLTTTITDPNFFLTFGSAPQSPSDIWFQSGSTYIYSNSYAVINNTTLHANFTIPSSVPAGGYDVFVYSWFSQIGYINLGFNVDESGITGHVYNDLNSNGIQEGGELGLPFKPILVQPGNHLAYTDWNGNYAFGLINGNYTVQFVPDTTWAVTSNPTVYNINTASSSAFGIDFGIHANNPWYGISTLLGLEGTPRCNTVRDFTVVIHNYGTAVQNGTVLFTKAAQLNYVSAVPVPTTISGNDFTWDYTNLQPNAYMSFTIRLIIPFIPSVQITNYAFTTARDLSGNVVDTAGFTLTNTILCSYDPNEKEVVPAGQSSQHFSPLNGEYFYTVHFQNTGNDTAFSVNIYDTIDVSMDINTFVYAGSSDYVQTFLEPNRVVRFYFPNINLPDSIIDEPGSHGFVSYRISPLAGLPDFTVVNNHADIVFDQNPPIVTNTVFNTLISFPTATPDKLLKEGEIRFFPNPVTSESVLTINQKGKHNYELRIYDSTGKLVKTARFSANTYVLNKKDFASGIYLFRLEELNGTFSKSGKLVME